MPNGFVTREEFNKLYAQVNGNGQPGMRQTLEEVGTTLAEIRGAQKERANIDERRFKLQTIVLSVLGFLLALLIAVEGWHHAKTGEYNFHKSLFDNSDPVYAHKQQPADAGADFTAGH